MNCIEIEKSSKTLKSKSNPDVTINTYRITRPNNKTFDEKFFMIIYNIYKKHFGDENLLVRVRKLNGDYKTIKGFAEPDLYLYKVHEKYSSVQAIDSPENMIFSEIIVSINNKYVKEIKENLLLNKLI